MSDTCECGDVFDEHEDNGGPCTVENCLCVAFAIDPDATMRTESY
jgi:hypothetical protein